MRNQQYFSEALIESDLDLNSVFPEKQKKAQDFLSVTYNLGDIVKWIATQTNNFRRKDEMFLGIDDGIKTVVQNHYKINGIENPFLSAKDRLEAVDKDIEDTPIQKTVKSKTVTLSKVSANPLRGKKAKPDNIVDVVDDGVFGRASISQNDDWDEVESIVSYIEFTDADGVDTQSVDEKDAILAALKHDLYGWEEKTINAVKKHFPEYKKFLK